MTMVLPLLCISSFMINYIAIATEESQYAEIGVARLQQCSSTSGINLCCEGFSTTTDVTWLRLTSLFCIFSVPALRNYHVEIILLPDAPQVFHLADGLSNVISRKRHRPMINDSNSCCRRISTFNCQACVIHLGCSSKLRLKHGDLVLKPDTDHCETHPETLVTGV